MDVSRQLDAPAALPPEERILGTHWIGGWPLWDAVGKRKTSCHSRQSNPGRSVLIPSLYRLSYPSSRFCRVFTQINNVHESTAILFREGIYRRACLTLHKELKRSVSRMPSGSNRNRRRKYTEWFKMSAPYFVGTAIKWYGTNTRHPLSAKVGTNSDRRRSLGRYSSLAE
jgi:hypothetical protein